VGDVVIGRRVRDEPEEVVGAGVAARIVPEQHVEAGRVDGARHGGELPGRVVGLGPDAHGAVDRLHDVAGAHGDRAVRGLGERRDLVDPVEPGDHGGRNARPGPRGWGRREERRPLLRARQAPDASAVQEGLEAGVGVSGGPAELPGVHEAPEDRSLGGGASGQRDQDEENRCEKSARVDDHVCSPGVVGSPGVGSRHVASPTHLPATPGAGRIRARNRGRQNCVNSDEPGEWRRVCSGENGKSRSQEGTRPTEADRAS